MLPKLVRQYVQSGVIFIALVSLYAIKRHVAPSEVIFYEGLSFGVMAGAALYAVCQWLKLQATSILPAILAFCLFVSLVPTILDRSVSITVLSSIERCSGCSIAEIETEFVEVYLTENQAIQKRINEQKISGSVEANGTRLHLTTRGEIILKIISFSTDFFNVERGYIDD